MRPETTATPAEYFEHRTVDLKDGRRAHLRPVTATDAAGLLEMDRQLVAEGSGMVLEAADLPADPTAHLEDLSPYIEGPRTGRRGLLAVARVEDEVAGSAQIHRFGVSRLEHCALTSIGIHPRLQGLGLGRRLMEHVLSWARLGPGRGIRRVELYVRDDNSRAIALYTSLGFVTEGVRKKFLHLGDGRYVDDRLMCLHIPSSIVRLEEAETCIEDPRLERGGDRESPEGGRRSRPRPRTRHRS